jgi:PAS domain S-box-containing protein
LASTGTLEIPATLIDAVNGLPDAVFLVTDSGVIVAANTAASKMFGYSVSQLVGSQVDELMPAAAREYHHKVRSGAASDRRTRQFTSGRTFECERRDGEIFQADIMLSPTTIKDVPMTWATVRDLDNPSEINAGRQQAEAALDLIGHMAATAFDLAEDFAVVADRLTELIPHERIGVALICEDDPEMVEIAFLAGDGHPAFVPGEQIPRSSSAIGWMYETRAHVSFKKAKTNFAPPAILAGLKKGYKEVCAAPLFDDDSMIGGLVLSTKDERGYSEFQKDLIDRLAEHLSVGIVNQRMRGKLEAKTQQTALVGEIGRQISSSSNLSSALTAGERVDSQAGAL